MNMAPKTRVFRTQAAGDDHHEEDLEERDDVPLGAPHRVQRVRVAHREEGVRVDRKVPEVCPELAHPAHLVLCKVLSAEQTAFFLSTHLLQVFVPSLSRSIDRL